MVQNQEADMQDSLWLATSQEEARKEEKQRECSWFVVDLDQLSELN
jgi:hypothetical protein